jgi:heptosyltransferase-2
VTPPEPPARVLVVQTSYLGDLVLSTPVFAALKERWPSAAVTVVVRPDVAPVLRAHPHLDAVLVNDKRGAHSGVRGFLDLVRTVRRGRYDLGIALHRGTRATLLLTLAEVPLRVGFRQGELGFLLHRRAWRDPERHDIERQLSVLGPLGFDVAGPRPPRLGVDPEAERAVGEMLAIEGIGSGRPYVVLAPGSAWRTKEWMPERFAETARGLLARDEAVVYVGAAAEVDTVEEVRRLAGGGISLAGRTDTAGLAAAIAGATAVVCNDSAPMHVAQALTVPVVVVVGPTSARQGFLPLFPPSEVLADTSLSCRPLCRFGGRPCALGTRVCLTAIDSQQVVEALDRVRGPQVPAGLGTSA